LKKLVTVYPIISAAWRAVLCRPFYFHFIVDFDWLNFIQIPTQWWVIKRRAVLWRHHHVLTVNQPGQMPN
jgi:hypothetical protein